MVHMDAMLIERYLKKKNNNNNNWLKDTLLTLGTNEIVKSDWLTIVARDPSFSLNTHAEKGNIHYATPHHGILLCTRTWVEYSFKIFPADYPCKKFM